MDESNSQNEALAAIIKDAVNVAIGDLGSQIAELKQDVTALNSQMEKVTSQLGSLTAETRKQKKDIKRIGDAAEALEEEMHQLARRQANLEFMAIPEEARPNEAHLSYAQRQWAPDTGAGYSFHGSEYVRSRARKAPYGN